MYKIDFSSPAHIYFVGIGGISMSGLAEVLREAGFKVSGSDRDESELTRKLEKMGVTVYYGQKYENITKDIDCVVFTSAIHPDNPEYRATMDLSIPHLTRAELLGQIMNNYKNSVAISGTHGKTTTTSMISEILLEADADPTLSIGGIYKAIGGNIKVGKSDIFVTEACEYTNSFLSLSPAFGIILNIEEDHLDFFKDINDIRNSFREFAKKIPPYGTLIINGDIDNVSEITDGLKCNIITFGASTGDASAKKAFDCTAEDITYNEAGHATFTMVSSNNKKTKISLNVPGFHNVLNALAAAACCQALGMDENAIVSGLKNFSGTDRRFEFKGIKNGVTIIDDYAHHPTEIRATLTAAKKVNHNRLWCVFQSHTFTRTKALMDDFAEVLTLADEIVLADIYAARETDNLGISSKTLQEKIQALGHKCYYFPSFSEIENFLEKNCINGDLLITMGAGDVYKIGENLLKK
ncbi:MAG: UDP-N-acetylmuramate--L-alanine ligase [Acetatifactor sp.]|nr:UDP-N-acetylmuramate--L-alanine ligase [Acetatifactor sp.]